MQVNICIYIHICHTSGQIIATSHDLTPEGSWGREIPLFQGNLGWWNILIWPDTWMLWVVRLSQYIFPNATPTIWGKSTLIEIPWAAMRCIDHQFWGECIWGDWMPNWPMFWSNCAFGSFCLLLQCSLFASNLRECVFERNLPKNYAEGQKFEDDLSFTTPFSKNNSHAKGYKSTIAVGKHVHIQ